MSEAEQLAQEQFKATFRNRLCEMLSEIEEEYISAFIQGYAKRETDEKFRTKQGVEYDYNNEVAKEYTTLQERIAELETQIEKMKCCYNCSKDCGSIDRRICFENKMKYWTIKVVEND